MHLHLDTPSGAAGDMIVAACLDLGVSFDWLKGELASLGVDGYALSTEAVSRSGIAATRFVVDDHHHADMHDHSHDHSHGHEHKHQNEGLHHHHHAGPNRHLKDLLGIVESAPFSESVKERASRIFVCLAEAEAEVHGQSLETVHFHEVSGVDTLLDVVGACLALEHLGVTSISCSPLTVGSGIIECAHGSLPAPAPATLAILRSGGIPFRQANVETELLTPTGAALLAGLVDRFGACPAMRCEQTGHGAGSREIPGRPNVLRALLGTLESGLGVETDTVFELRAMVDDMTPEATAYCLERCLTVGALDAYALHGTMKKGRPGLEIVVLTHVDKLPPVRDTIFRESSTFGIRISETPRQILPRTVETVDVQDCSIRIKIGRIGDEVVHRQPEFEDCRAAACVLGLPLQEVMRLALEKL